MTIQSIRLADLYKLNSKVFNTDELVRKEVNKIIEHRHFKISTLYFNSL